MNTLSPASCGRWFGAGAITGAGLHVGLHVGLLVGLFAGALPAPVLAETPADCRVAESQLDNSFPLPRVEAAISNKKLEILVIGAGSSRLPGPQGTMLAYPARLQNALSQKLPDVAVKVAADVKLGRTAHDMLPDLRAAVAPASRPALVIWQTGTVDAVRSVEPEAFSKALTKGVAAAKAAGTDVVLMNMQYSPRTESMIALGNYADSMRWVALQFEVPLFDRFQVMKTWNEMGVFDLYRDTKKMDIAERVHDCIGRLLADLIIGAAQPGGAVPPIDVK
ncbi:MAG TPA: SGNH/GDSL hydrolase family protein [Pseudolabrys sp.]|nr:SGNH/GDSL hydrolase family protein [Pseudolabrys sp.]